MRSILVLSGKGGCGKSTIATNLAAAFAASGRRTALAEMDRQKSSAGWLAARPPGAARIEGLDWRRERVDPPRGMERVVIDVPAGMRVGPVEGLLQEADVLLVPVLPSPFDEASTRRLVRRLAELKPIRRERIRLCLVANRVRPRSRAAARLAEFLAGLDHPVLASLSDRALYGELAGRGLGLFDLQTSAIAAARAEWAPLVRALDGPG
ncbi:MAG TPA: ParA family protein [Geminicoccaceae bacterium]|nr:ParA family protein [Geminicoccus sp.]HMU50223.1 ParA family protein [Geminicoccaceae bacterium]